jgi:hypothetical protein
MTLGKIVRRFFLYIGIALSVLVVFAVVIVFGKGAGGHVPSAWIALVVYTSTLFWIIIRQSKQYWHHASFWLTIAGLLFVHVLAFVAILRAYTHFRGIWFMPIVIVEGGLFGAILYLLFGDDRQH